MKFTARLRPWAFLLLGSSLLLLVSFTATKSDRYFEIAKNMRIFAKLYEEVNTYYVDEVNPSMFMGSAIDAMLATLDPYTNYISEDKIEDYRTMTTGEYGGIGVSIGMMNGQVTILGVNQGFAASKAGIRIGDRILKADGIVLSGKEGEEVNRLLKGQAGTELRLSIDRLGEAKPLELQLRREKIQLRNVPYYGMVTQDIGMIRLTDFTRKASKEVRDALLDLKAQGAKKIILDLRGNPGGLLNEAIEISNIFLPKGSEIVTTKGRIQDWNRQHNALDNPADTEIPLAVLINGNSASAAEIVSGVMQDYDRGVLVGERSFGKGLVQATRPLEFNSKLKITVAKYYIPSGRCIQAIDYSHREEDGKAGKVPDSLRVAFKTRNGRTVYDGGGVSPDVPVARLKLAPVSQALLRNGLIFDYATLYRQRNAQIAQARQFALTDAEFEQFVQWAKGRKYDYTTKVEKSLEELVASAQDDRYYDDIKAQIKQLEDRIGHNKEQDLYKFRPEIRELLEEEIAKRYYMESGAVEASFDDDEDVLTAIRLLSDPQAYAKLLK